MENNNITDLNEKELDDASSGAGIIIRYSYEKAVCPECDYTIVDEIDDIQKELLTNLTVVCDGCHKAIKAKFVEYYK